jgi:type VI secretion system protein ImpF
MPQPDASSRLRPSILDRLVDPDSMGTASAPGYDPREMMDAVRADVEELLNTRRMTTDVPAAFEELRDSILTYGLPDLVRYNGTSQEQCAELARVIAETITRYEPRLRQVKVTIVRGQTDARLVKFHIDAALNVDPSPEVGFETVLELTTGRSTVKSDGSRT